MKTSDSTTAGRVARRMLRLALVLPVLLLISACDDPQVYGSVGVSSGYGGYGGYHGGYGGWGSPRMRTSVSVGGRIR